MWYKYPVEYYSAIKKNEMPFAATWVDLEIIILSEVQAKTNVLWYHLYLVTKNATNELIYNIQIDSDFKNKLMMTKGKGKEGEG